MMQPFDKLSREPTLADRVAASILQRIVVGEFSPGDKLPSEREVGDQFGVSRTVAAVPESLTLLLRGNQAFDRQHVHEVRGMLEVQMAGAAAERATADDVASVRRAADAMERARGVEQAAQRDLDFHRPVAQATRNPLYLVLHDAIGEALIEVRRASLARGGGAEATESHSAIVKCIAAHNRKGAESAMRRHLEAVEQLWERTA